jgi:hypothetical protein
VINPICPECREPSDRGHKAACSLHPLQSKGTSGTGTHVGTQGPERRDEVRRLRRQVSELVIENDRLKALGAAPVPPAGDVEGFVVPSCENSYGFGYVDGTCIQSLRGYRDHLEEIVDSLPEGKLIHVETHHAHVTRLTAEVERLRGLYDTYCRPEQVKAYRERDEAQSELTKAREFLVHVKKCLVRNKEYSPLSHQELDGLIGHSPSASCRNECGCLWCHQSAPATKVCPQPQAHPARCGCEQE